MTLSSVTRVKNIVTTNVGQKVKFRIKKGKSKPQTTEGIIKDAYPSIFTVLVENKGLNRIVSFNYIDIVTNVVELFICDKEDKRIV